MGEGILEQGTVEALTQLLLSQYSKSDDRIKENNELAKGADGAEDEDDVVD